MRTDDFSEYHPNTVRHLRKIERANDAIARAQADLDSAVRAARNHSAATWSMIGHVLGTTRQAAQMRFRYIGTDRALTADSDS